MRMFSCMLIIITAGLLGPVTRAGELPIVKGVEAQPLKSQAQRIAQALDFLGEPLSKVQRTALDRAFKELNEEKAVIAIQKVFDPLCIAGVNINPESRVKVPAGPVSKTLHEQGWRAAIPGGSKTALIPQRTSSYHG